MNTDPVALAATTRLLPAGTLASSLMSILPDADPLAWIHRGDGIVGWGRTAEVRTSGPTRFTDAAKWWAETAARSEEVIDPGAEDPGTGLVCFGSFAFTDAIDAAGTSLLVVPEIVVGRRGDRVWVTRIRRADAPVPVPDTAPDPLVTEQPAPSATEVLFSDGAVDSEQWMTVVKDAVTRIQRGEVEKIVLARDLVATTTEPGRTIDVRGPLARLASAYPVCWTFHVDGLFGATPEMLVRRERGLVTSRVLAGTIRRTGDDQHDSALAGTLTRSSKDLEEHEYAVRSVAESLEPHCSSMNVPEAPFVLHLPNVMHLATDVAGVAHDTATSLDLAAALHPSAAVGGTPTSTAVDLIAEIEGMDRGRYAGPVGWMDAGGDGEWGIALRSAQLSPDRHSARLFAGCGVVSDSDPAAELAESQSKLIPVRDALSG